jgi:deoxyribodipyrimidine photo-lyase
MFEPTNSAALKQLAHFLPNAGSEYLNLRNYDFGPKMRSNVSMLSPWVRTRLLPEWEILRSVLAVHSPAEASKFIDEICWRSYWKGWLEKHPSVWDNYLLALKAAKLEPAQNTLYSAVLRGDCDIECMNLWTQELLKTGYLHNHARMWFASIWIHTLKLPWTLGAAFFLKHLLDGDAASNTLSWRWVAGLHTAGKTYSSTADNIEKYTQGRIKVSTPLASVPAALDPNVSAPQLIELKSLQAIPQVGRIGLLISEDDLSAQTWIPRQVCIKAVAGLIPRIAYQLHAVSDRVYAFRRASMQNILPSPNQVFEDIQSVVAWASKNQLDTVCMAEPTIGLWNAVTPALTDALAQNNIQLLPIRHWFDQHLYSKADRGFFRFKKAIPSMLDRLTSEQ